jgi:hypothetical protein
MGLLVHGKDDGLDAQHANWDKLDQSYSGVIWVPNDTIPDSNILYEGARVAELLSGKVWRAEKNLDGSYSRKWLKYPWLFSASFSQTNFPRGGDDHPWPYTTVESQCLNSGANDLVDGRLVIPVKGIYRGRISGLWSQGGGSRGQKLAIGTLVDTDSTEVLDKSWTSYPSPINNYHFNRIFQVGDTICGAYWHDGPDPGVILEGRINIQCVRPL